MSGKMPLYISLLLLILCIGCKRIELPVGTPTCVKEIIRDILKEEVRDPPSELWKWEHYGETSFYVLPYCCDEYSALYTEDCFLICAPDGGLYGIGDGACPYNYNQMAIVRTLIWADKR
ncbi:MAG: hypothetical protein IIA45_05510 [Bacteroidetes bacterium]|nr:hypothetical protein [Bacteroidota bacterium]